MAEELKENSIEKEQETAETPAEQTAAEQENSAAAERENSAVVGQETAPESAKGPDEEAEAQEKKPQAKDDDQLLAAIEAILFTMGEAVEVGAIAKALEVSTARVKKAVSRLQKKYASPSRGIMIQEFDDAVQMSTKPEQYENLIRIAKVPKKMTLSDSVIETLSIIAYKQPITKVEVEGIRGVSCDYAINKLLEYDLIKELGRKDAPGRPILFGTTEQFLRSFGVKNLAELPSLNTVQVEEFKEEAEAEVDDRLGI